MRVRALVLAAGYGTRLGPLTDSRPKPLLPVRGKPVVELTLERLAAAGCEAIALNLHHLGGAIRERYGDSFREVPLTYSEEPEILGTLGAFGPLRDFFAAADAVVLVNGDSLCRWPLRRLIRRHAKGRAAATLLFAAAADPARFGGGVAVERKGGRILSFRAGPGDPEAERRDGIRRLVFAGAHVLAPSLLERVGEGFADVVANLYQPLLAEGQRLQAVITGRPWYDLGTPRRLRNAATTGGAGHRLVRLVRRNWVAADARLAPGVRLRRSVVEADAVVGRGASLRRTVLLPGARVGPGAVLEGCVVGWDADVPPESRVRERLICRRTAGGTVPDGSSVVGEVVYSGLDP
jgi:mannose-1-phosphate guanylyltransferase